MISGHVEIFEPRGWDRSRPDRPRIVVQTFRDSIRFMRTEFAAQADWISDDWRIGNYEYYPGEVRRFAPTPPRK